MNKKLLVLSFIPVLTLSACSQLKTITREEANSLALEIATKQAEEKAFTMTYKSSSASGKEDKTNTKFTETYYTNKENGEVYFKSVNNTDGTQTETELYYWQIDNVEYAYTITKEEGKDPVYKCLSSTGSVLEFGFYIRIMMALDPCAAFYVMAINPTLYTQEESGSSEADSESSQSSITERSFKSSGEGNLVITLKAAGEDDPTKEVAVESKMTFTYNNNLFASYSSNGKSNYGNKSVTNIGIKYGVTTHERPADWETILDK